jgi:hypothetical protein
MTRPRANCNKMETEKLDVWELIQGGCFEQACELADAQYQETKTPTLVLRNKILALLHLKRYKEASHLSEWFIQHENGISARDFQTCGIANWLLGDREESVALWKRARDSTFQAIGGGIETEIMLFFTSVKTNDAKLGREVASKLKKLLKRKGHHWPKPLGQYVLGQITEEELLASVPPQAILRERGLCQAYFAVAVKSLERGDAGGYRLGLEKTINLGPASYLEMEYYLAKGELALV